MFGYGLDMNFMRRELLATASLRLANMSMHTRIYCHGHVVVAKLKTKLETVFAKTSKYSYMHVITDFNLRVGCFGHC